MGDESGGAALMADRAYDRLIAMLRDGSLPGGTFLSMPALVDRMDFPLAATREAVKRADAHGLVTVEPKRGVRVMSADPDSTRDCLDLRAILDAEGARRLVASGEGATGLGDLRASHEGVLAAARFELTSELPRIALATDLSLHDALGAGLGNPLAAEAYSVNRHRVAVIQNTRPFVADRIVSAMEEHLAIISALEASDAEAAVAAIRHHHRTTLRWWGVGF